MAGKNPSGKIQVILRILELFSTYKELSAGRILSKLVSEGYMKPSSRRLLNYYLEELQRLGIIELKGKGRGAKWHLKKESSGSTCNLDKEQKALIALGVLSMPDFLVESLRSELETLFEKVGLSKEMLAALGLDIHVKYLYGLAVQGHLGKLANILEAIKNKKFVTVVYDKGKGEEVRTLLPIGVALRRGKIYMTAVDRDGKRKIFALERIKGIVEREKRYGGRHYPRPDYYLTLDEEKAFVFGMELDKKLPLTEKELSFSPLVFYHKIENGERLKKIYLVGFTGRYFASRFIPFLYGKLLYPDEHILSIARRKKLNNFFPSLELSDPEENQKRFYNFMKTLKEILVQRQTILEKSFESIED
jgi:predicted DNA-binding transcriptional regulator YafY